MIRVHIPTIGLESPRSTRKYSPMHHFTKMNGAGNDFILLDNRDLSLNLPAATIAHWCDRHRGIGADGVLLLEPAATAGADFRMRYFNSDGGEAEMCGNGARCFARFARHASGCGDALCFETQAGIIRAQIEGEAVSLIMSEPKDMSEPVDLDIGGVNFTIHAVNTGVPHAVIFTDNLERADVAGLGSAIRHHLHFAPKGANVNFVQVLAPGHIAIRTFERGVEAETLACGTGVVASALVAHRTVGSSPPVLVNVRGGDTLRVNFHLSGTVYQNVTLTGPADFVFEGGIDG